MKIRHVMAGLSLASVIGIASSSALARNSENISYQIRVQNVTAGNVLSPFLAFVSSSDFQVVQLGSVASPGVAALAETGNRSILTSELQGSGKASSIVAAEGGPILPGESRTIELSVPSTSLRQGARLDLLAMIGRSNDSFVRLGSIPLAKVTSAIGSTFVLNTHNYDAGSEENTGNVEDFGSGGHPTEAAEGRVSLDRGLNPRGNAPDIFSWGSTAAIVSITRLN